MIISRHQQLRPLAAVGLLLASTSVARAQPAPADPGTAAPATAAPPPAAPSAPGAEPNAQPSPLAPAPRPPAEPTPGSALQPAPPPAPEPEPAPPYEYEEPQAPSDAQLEQAQSGYTGESGWYHDKGEQPYLDVLAGWGWGNRAYQLTITPLALLIHEEDEGVGFYVRGLAVGAISYERERTGGDGVRSKERHSAVVLEVFQPFFRFYLAGPVYLSLGMSFGLAWYDGTVPTFDGLGGLGFTYGGWGLQAGIRSSRLPEEVMIVAGKQYLRDVYRPQLYVGLETDITLF